MTKVDYIREMGQRLNAYWPHSDIGRAQLAAMWHTLGDIPLEQQLAALEALYRDGREHAPNGGQLRAKLVDLSLDTPTWAEAKRALLRRNEVNLAQSGCEECDGSTYVLDDQGFAHPCSCRQERVSQAHRTHHPLIASFLEEVGSDELRDLGESRTAEAQTRDKYLAHVRRAAQEGRLAGMEPAGLRTLERVNREPKRLGEAVRLLSERAA